MSHASFVMASSFPRVTVLRGAQARREFVESTPAAWVQARAQLVSQGVVLENPAGLTLAQDDEFNSPSRAAMALLARTANGRIAWKDTKGVTNKEHQERAAAAASAGVEA